MPFGLAFGIAAAEADLVLWQTTGFSVLVFTGSAQFAAVEVLGSGGSVAAATVAGLLLNVRSLAFGVVMAPALQGRWWQRAAWSQLLIDESTAVASTQPDRHLRRYAYLCTGTTLFVAWNVSTVLGATVVPTAGDLVTDWGIDAAIPAVFLALVWPRLSQAGQRRTAVGGALLALAATPFTPAGIPIAVAGAAVALGWRRPRSDASPPPGGAGTTDSSPDGTTPNDPAAANAPTTARTGGGR